MRTDQEPSLTEPFGWCLQLDLHECDVEALTNERRVQCFFTELCDDVLRMRRFGNLLLERFGAGDPKTFGYSAVQLIEMSSVVAHFAEHSRRAYLDVFSCRPFDASRVTDFARSFFGAASATSRFVERR